MEELFVRCNCGARLYMQMRQSGNTARCPKCDTTISAPRNKVFELWNGEELSVQELHSIEKFESRDSTEAVDQTSAYPAIHRPISPTAEGLAKQFEDFTSLLQSQPDHPLFDTPISEWTEPGDTALPFKFLRWPIRRVLETPFVRIASSWTSDERVICLMNHLNRAMKAIESRTGCRDENETDGILAAPQMQLPRELTRSGRGWRTYCEIVERNNLQPVHLGMVAFSLHELPSTLWKRQVGEFSSMTLRALSEVPGLGPQKQDLIIDIFRELATHLQSIPSETHLATSLLPKPIQAVNLWLDDVLGTQRIPDVNEIAMCFMRPLMMQLRIDITDELASMVVRRIGIDGTPETLEEIANDVGLSRERVRQLTRRATEVVQVRWPHGKHLLDDFYDLLRSASDAQRQLAFVRTILDRCFDVEFASSGSRNEVLSAWQHAGRQRLTPMREREIAEWLAGHFPRIVPEIGVSWICEGAPNSTGIDGQRWYFTDEPLDQLLHKIYEQQVAVTMNDIVELVGGHERSLSGRIARDPRFVEIDDKRIHSSQHCSIERVADIWHVRLAPQSSGTAPRLETISVENLVHLIVGGLTQIGIADATVWGVHRFVNDVLARIYSAHLPETVSPFVLQDLLIGQSNDVIRRMRRRRLRWDCADGSIHVRGKRGWVGYAIQQSGVPMTLEELGAELRMYYQDYEFYVLQQLPLSDDDEGQGLSDATFFPGVAHRVPPIVFPDSWALDVDRENVSEAIKLIAGKIVDVSRKKGFPKCDLEQIPWLIELVDHYACGKMIWRDAQRSTDEILAASARVANIEPSTKHESKAPAEPAWEVDEENKGDVSTLDNIMNQLDDLL